MNRDTPLGISAEKPGSRRPPEKVGNERETGGIKHWNVYR